MIGIAVGTVLLPEMAQPAGARRRDRRAPRAEPRDRIHAAAVDPVPGRVPAAAGTDHARAVHARRLHRGRRGGRRRDAAAYAIGLLPFVLMRSAAVTFLARGDTWTPVKALFFAVLVNVALKIVLMGSLRAGRSRLRDVDRRLGQSRAADLVCAPRRACSRSTPERRPLGDAAGGWPAWCWRWCSGSRTRRCARWWRGGRLHDELALALLALIGAVVYGAMVLVLFGRRWLARFRAGSGRRRLAVRRTRQAAVTPPQIRDALSQID